MAPGAKNGSATFLGSSNIFSRLDPGRPPPYAPHWPQGNHFFKNKSTRFLVKLESRQSNNSLRNIFVALAFLYANNFNVKCLLVFLYSRPILIVNDYPFGSIFKRLGIFDCRPMRDDQSVLNY